MSILSVRQLHIMGKQNHIVKNLSLDVQEGEWFALVGQSGSGKSMTAMAICQLLAPNLQAKGEIWYGEKNLINPIFLRNQEGSRKAPGLYFSRLPGFIHTVPYYRPTFRRISANTFEPFQKGKEAASGQCAHIGWPE